jgi:hypothetical protein
VVPADEFTLVEKGVLKNLMNNRTLTDARQSANGFGDGPGVIEVTINQKNSEKALKDKLIAQAKKEGLDYAIIVRDEPYFGQGLVNVYKVNVRDGKEEFVRNAILNPGNLKTLKRILGASGKSQAYNLAGNDNGLGLDVGMVSYIVPDALLLEEMELQPFRMPLLKEEVFVKSPLK